MEAQLTDHFEPDGPGAAIGVARDGEPALEACIGMADREARIAITPRTSFDLASVSKMFTGAAVVRLEAQGRLPLDDPVGRYLPVPMDSVGRSVTVRDLLWHTSGLPDYLAAAPDGGPLQLVPGALLERAGAWIASARPGVQYQYSSTNDARLAEVIAGASGAAHADVLRREIFDPLALADTFVPDPPARPDGCARGYRDAGFGRPRFERSELDLPVVGDGGVWSSLADLLRWLAAYFGGDAIGSAALARAMEPARLDDGTLLSYAGGLIVESHGDGGTWYGHTGGWYGATRFVGRFAEERISVVVLANEEDAPEVRIAQRALAAWRATRDA